MSTLFGKLILQLCFLLLISAANFSYSQGFEQVSVGSGIYGIWGVTAGDYDGDGDVDCAATGKSLGTVIWMETRANQFPVEHFLYAVTGGARYITSADFDFDGDIDILVSGYGEDRFILFENRGSDYPDRFALVTLQENTDGAWQAVPLDVDNNGTMDIATAGYVEDIVTLHRTSVNGVHSVLYSVEIDDPIGLFAADYDRDGDMDLLVASSSMTAGGIYWIEQTAPLEFELRELAVESGRRLTSLSAADLDGDEDIDIATTRLETPQDRVTWWEQRAGGLTPHDLDGYVDIPRNVALADFDDDGLVDIAATWQSASYGAGGINWWQNIGDGEFEYHQLHEGDSPYDLGLTDFDQDGDPDLLAAYSVTSEITLLRNEMGTQAVIQGSITSLADGEPISGVQVSVVELGSMAISDSAGFFSLGVVPGLYSLRAWHACWEDTVFMNVEAVEDQTSEFDFELRRPLITLGSSSLNLHAPNAVESVIGFPITNSGDAELTVFAEVTGNNGSDSWLSISPRNAIIPPGEDLEFQITIEPDTSDAASWDYYGTAVFHSDACPDTVIGIPIFVRVLDAPLQGPEIPTTTQLYPVYPNPFNSSARIEFDLAEPGYAELQLYDVQGRIVEVLHSGLTEAGRHTYLLTADHMASGVYFIRLSANRGQQTRKLQLLK